MADRFQGVKDRARRLDWRESRTLVVSADDPRLDAFERQFVINLGTRLYGALSDAEALATK